METPALSTGKVDGLFLAVGYSLGHEITTPALHKVAGNAFAMGTGARALRTELETILSDVLFPPSFRFPLAFLGGNHSMETPALSTGKVDGLFGNAFAMGTGARALRTELETILSDAMFEAPGSSVKLLILVFLFPPSFRFPLAFLGGNHSMETPALSTGNHSK
jgi:arginase family enzyme